MLQSLQTFDHNTELHSVVGGVGLTSFRFSAVGLVSQNTRPPLDPRVSNARTIRRQDDVFHFTKTLQHEQNVPLAFPESSVSGKLKHAAPERENQADARWLAGTFLEKPPGDAFRR